MTIAISLKVHDGVVLAADSASTLLAPTPGGVGVVNVYNNANKIFNLCKGLPVGALTWGAGNIGASSTSTLAKDFRRRLSGESRHEWNLDRDNYSVLKIAERLCDFMYAENYLAAFADWPQKPAMGFMVCGYSSGSPLAEEWQINIQDGACAGPVQVRALDDAGVTWNGDPEAITRLLFGMSTVTPQVLLQLGLQDRIDEIVSALREAQIAPLVQAAMPSRTQPTWLTSWSRPLLASTDTCQERTRSVGRSRWLRSPNTRASSGSTGSTTTVQYSTRRSSHDAQD